MRARAAEYELVRPGSLAAVLELMVKEPWTPIAGGTELMVQFGAGRLRVRRLVDIFGLPELTVLATDERELTVGAGVTYTRLRTSEVVSRDWPLLARAASWTGAVANQNRGTLGGNLANGSPAADTPPALLAYDAEVSLVSVRGVRRLPYASFHTGYKRNVLAGDELLLAVHVPRPAAGSHHYLRKVGPRNAQAISKVALGAVAEVVHGRVEGCRVGLASVAAAPYRCRAVETAVNGQVLDAGLVQAARAALLGEIRPLDDIRSTGAYRAQVAANLLEEFLGQLGTQAKLRGFAEMAQAEAEALLLGFCGSRRWAAEMAAGRPFAGVEELQERATAVWFGLGEKDWLEAFACHPRIGERRGSSGVLSSGVLAPDAFAAHSDTEQAAAQASLAAVEAELAQGNRVYEERFGFVYLVFASGRSAPELLGILKRRLGRTRAEELAEAAREQDKITQLRLGGWLGKLQ